ncbi:MAG TPA: lipocalin family protein [Chitinophagaceae bacterium]|nr:lipocalin family protein [Chitinophagaceae bacterium]
MKKLLLFPLMLMVVCSCKKNKDNNPSCTTNVTSISGSYKITAYTYKASASAQEIDYYTTLFPDACDRDNVLSFNANGTYQLIDAGIVCSPSGDDNGTWSLSGNTITVDGDAAAIESFDCKTLVLSNADIVISGDKLKITLTRQ